MTDSPLAWIALIGAIAILLVIDLLVVGRRGGEMSLRFASLASVVWVAIALGFGGLLALIGETGAAADYTAGYLVEKSLSLDNVFVFLLVFSAFGVAQAERHRLLTYGIVGALVMRAVFIVVGAAALHSFSWVAYIFAAFLLYTGVKLLRHRHDHDGETALVEKIQKRLPLKAGGAALAAIAIVDIIFAVDSVPAILAITTDTFIVFAANAFALLGLRALFFLVKGLLDRLVYLSAGLALILAFIGVKLMLHWAHVDVSTSVPEIPTPLSLVVIAVILAVVTVASLLKTRSDPSAKAHPGSLRAHPATEDDE